MNLFQKVLISCMIALLFSISLIGMYLYRKLIYPINTLMETMQKVGNGNLSLRVNDNYDLLELQRFGQTFNEMLTKINDLKLEAYEKKLDLKQAQLQYLQLQIRPHFYLQLSEKPVWHGRKETIRRDPGKHSGSFRIFPLYLSEITLTGSVWKKKFTLYPAILNCNSYIFLVGRSLELISRQIQQMFWFLLCQFLLL